MNLFLIQGENVNNTIYVFRCDDSAKLCGKKTFVQVGSFRVMDARFCVMHEMRE